MKLTEKKVLPTKLLVKEPPKEEKITGSGIIIPEIASRITCEGEVVLTGEGTPLLPMSVSVGNSVLFSPHAAIKVKIDDDEFFLLNITDVLLYW